MTAGLRKTAYERLVADAGVTALIPVSRWYERGGVVDSPEKPFGVLVWLDRLASGGRWLYPMEVWVHDNRGDYTRIEAVLKEVKRVFEGTVHYVGTNGVRITQADYVGESGDLDDPDRGTGAKHNNWLVVGGG